MSAILASALCACGRAPQAPEAQAAPKAQAAPEARVLDASTPAPARAAPAAPSEPVEPAALVEPAILPAPAVGLGAALDAGLEPALAAIAAVADADADAPARWHALARRHGVEVAFADAAGVGPADDGPAFVLVEIDANARFLVWNDGERIRDEAPLPPGFAGALVEALGPTAITPLPTASRTRLRAWVRPAALAALGALVAERIPAGLVRQRRPEAACTGGAGGGAAGRIVSEGAAPLGAPALHRAGARGQGVRVHVIDSGFRGIASTAADEVGAFGFLGSQTDLELDANGHGTACAEVIRDLAPDCDLAVYRLDAALDIETATRLALDNGTQVMSVSIAWLGYPWNGAACDAAREATARGVHWVAAAGNYGDRYWEARAPRVAANGYVEIAPGLVANALRVPQGAPIQLGFGYEMTGAASARLELTLLESRGGGAWRPIVTAGTGWDQYIHWWPEAGARYAVGIRRASAGTIGRMRLYLYQGSLAHRSAEGSVVNPATLDPVLSIGAVAASQYAWWGQAEVYSARGGGVFRLPLDGSAPSVVTTATLPAFDGTSAAAPAFAGLLAALASHPATASRPLDAILWTDLWPRGWDVASGRGLARAPALR